MYQFRVIKSPESSNEKFESAIQCVKDCVASVLDCEPLNVKTLGDTIVIQPFSQKLSMNMTLAECKKKIKGCFLDVSGNMYPEFKKIEAVE
jgi:hypothetical protein